MNLTGLISIENKKDISPSTQLSYEMVYAVSQTFKKTLLQHFELQYHNHFELS